MKKDTEKNRPLLLGCQEELEETGESRANSQRPLLEEDLNYAIDSTVPLSVTQAESIRALRQWANVRAVAATAREDLENYEKSDPEEPETDIRKSRGGRSLDF